MGKILTTDYSATAFYERALDKIEKEEYLEAIGDLWSAIARDKNEPDYYIELADCYSALGVTERALKYYFKVIDLDKKYEDAYVGLMQTYAQLDRPEMALYYLSMGLDVGVLGEEYEPDEDYLREELSETAKSFSSPQKPRLSMLKKHDCSQTIVTAKKMIMGGQTDMAKEMLLSVPKQSDQYLDSQKTLASLAYADGDMESAVYSCDKILSENPSDVYALSIGIASNHNLGNLERKEELCKRVESLEVTDRNDLYRIALSFSEAKEYQRASRYYEKLTQTDPYDREIALCSALAHYNCNERAYAQKKIKQLRIIYPEDAVIAYYSRHIIANKVDDIPVISTLPDGERLRRLHRIEETFSQLRDVEAVTKRLAEDEELYEMIIWLFSSSDSGLSAHVADFLCQNSYWQEVIRDLLLEPLLPASTKKDYLVTYLKNSECKRFTLLVGDILQSFIVRKPKCNDGILMSECYYETYGVLAFISADFSKQLNREYKRVVDILNSPSFESFVIDKKVMSAVLCYMIQAHPMMKIKQNCCEVFECRIEDFNEYLYRLGVEKRPTEQNEEGNEERKENA